MYLDSVIKAKTQGEILNVLAGTGKRFYAVPFKGKKQVKNHIGAKAYRTISLLH